VITSKILIVIFSKLRRNISTRIYRISLSVLSASYFGSLTSTSSAQAATWDRFVHFQIAEFSNFQIAKSLPRQARFKQGPGIDLFIFKLPNFQIFKLPNHYLDKLGTGKLMKLFSSLALRTSGALPRQARYKQRPGRQNRILSSTCSVQAVPILFHFQIIKSLPRQARYKQIITSSSSVQAN
jgi:hypothetical protein